MIESVSDFLSVAIMAFFVLEGCYFLYELSVKHHEAAMQRIESAYYRYYETADEDEDDDDRDEIYYED